MNETKRCSKCHKELPLSEFWKNKSSRDGLQAYCKKCAKERTKQHQKEHPEIYREISKRSWWKNRKKRTETDRNRMSTHFNFINSLKTPCVKCGEDRFYVIDFHHIDPSKKLFTISDGQKAHKSKEDVLEEVKKCVCLCKNCHKEFHYFYGVKSEHPVEDLEKYLKEGVHIE
jgi:hypothetical protein